MKIEQIESAKYFNASPPDVYKDEDTGEDLPIGIFLKLKGDDLVYNVPISEDNRHYRAIQEWVDAGNTIANAD